MARTGAAFNDGTISTSLSVVVGPVPVGQTWYVTRLDGANTGSADVDLVFFTNVNGTVRRLSGGTIDASGGSYEAIDKSVILEAGDMLLAQASVADVVTYYAAGIKESA